MLEEEFKPQGYKVPTCESPNILIKFSSLFDSQAKTLVPSLGKVRFHFGFFLWLYVWLTNV